MKRFLSLFLLAAPLLAQVSLPSNQSRVAGRFVAWNYGGWSLQLYKAPAGTGSQTFSVTTASVQLGDGRQIMPFATNAPLKVGNETVTVSAVGANCVLSWGAPGYCVLTATFSNKHTTADAVSSGTFGLQEALNDAGASGGGAVTVDSTWANAGGTSGMVSAATLPSNTGIEDARTGAPAGSGGTVTSVSIATANGVSGSCSSGATPACTIVLGAIAPTTVNANGNITLVPAVSAGPNRTLSFGEGYGVAAVDLYDAGTGPQWGWGLNAGEMQFFGTSNSANHISFNSNLTPGLKLSGTGEIMRLTLDTGNLGIGTIVPGSKLTVKGGDAFVDGTATGVILRDTVTTTNCYRITIASGLVTPTSVTCPTD